MYGPECLGLPVWDCLFGTGVYICDQIFIDPSMMPKMQVDYGAIKFVLRGSNIMCPGLTSPGGRMEDIPAGTVVVSHSTSCLESSCFL